MVMPEIEAKPAGSKLRAMNTVHTRNAGAHPIPIRIWPSTSWAKPCADAATIEPATASGKAASTVRRTPYRSMPIPMKSCSAPNEK
jgi:hypothetical protein